MAPRRAPADLEHTVQRALVRAGVARTDGLLVAFSGGADSTALVNALRGGPNPLTLVHVDHGLRSDSGVDARHCEEAAAALGLVCIVERVHTPPKRQARGPEDAARVARFTALARVAQARQLRHVVLGHTMDDVAETVLLRATRGTGVGGLAAMTLSDPAPWDPAIRLVRPLLELRRADTRAYCRERDLPFRDDPTNEDPAIPRNYVRHHIVPRLEALNAGAVRHLAALARDAAAAGAVLDSLVEATAGELATGPELDRARFRQLAPYLQRRLVAETWRRFGLRGAALTRPQIEACASAAGGPTGRRIALPGGFVWVVDYGRLRLTPGVLPGEPPVPVPLPAAGTVQFGDWQLVVEPAESADQTDTPQSGLLERFDASVADAGAVIRAWRPGDRIALRGSPGHVKLQDVFTDARVGRSERQSWPVLALEHGRVIWVPGLRRGPDFAPRAGAPALAVRARRS